MIKINQDYLNAGIRFWLEEKPQWSRSFHNNLYQHLIQVQVNGFTNEWWEEILDILRQWVALRPKTKQFIRQRGQARLSELTLGYKQLLNKCQGQIPSNALLEWKDIEPLFTIAKEIKGVSSPVFASKLCHFIVPSVFPVIDQEVLGGSHSYQDYWQFCKGLWQTTGDKNILIKTLSDKIGKDIIPTYPWSTKIVELCLIGQRVSKKLRILKNK